MLTHQYNRTGMTGRTAIRVTTVIVALVAAAAAYSWWNSPERVIHRMLEDVASALSHDTGDTDLQALAAVASLQSHLAPDVSIDPGPPGTMIRGRQDVISAAARLRATSRAMRVQFFDARIDVLGDTHATTQVTAQVTTTDREGQDLASAHLVSMVLVGTDGQWQVTEVRILPQSESSP